MIWKNKKVNLNNYLEVFKDYPRGVREVVRSAILDDSLISEYIDRYRDNPYMLWQVKMAIDEGLEEFWLVNAPSGDILDKLRELVERGININPLRKHFSLKLPTNYYNYIIKWYGDGISLDKYDFSIVPQNLLDCFDLGLTRGYDMRPFNNGVDFDSKYMVACMSIMSNGKDITKYLKGDWDNETIMLLASYSKSKYYDKMIGYVYKEITPTVLEELFLSCKEGLSLEEISKRDEWGTYIYMGSQIKIIREAYLSNLDYSQLYQPKWGINKLLKLRKELELNASKKVTGRLRKN